MDSSATMGRFVERASCTSGWILSVEKDFFGNGTRGLGLSVMNDLLGWKKS